MDARVLLDESNPRKAARELESLFAGLVKALDTVVEPAVHGRISAVRSYVRLWRDLQAQVLAVAGEARPDLIARLGDRVLVVDVKGHASGLLTSIVEQGALHAPFSPWVSEFGSGTGVALFMLADVRKALRASTSLLPPVPFAVPYPDVGEQEFRRFARLVYRELTAGDPLRALSTAFDLSDTELGRLFGVTRQAVGQWMTEGVPSGRLQRVHTMQRIADVLARNLKADRIPAIVRKPAAGYGGRSILDAVSAGDEDQVLEILERTFDWAATA